MRQFKILLSLSLIIALVAGSVMAESGTFSKTYPATKSVVLKANLGSLELKSWDRDEIMVECDYNISGDMYVDPVIRERKNRLTIKSEIEGRYQNRYQATITWTLTVPVGTEVNFNSTSGGVDVYNFDGELEGNTASGSIEIKESKGNFDFNTASGSIRIEDCSGEFYLNTASGRVKANDSKGIFKLTSASGVVSIDEITLEGESVFTTASGDAFVSLAATTEYDIEVSSASGDATLDFNGNKIEGFIEMKASEQYGDIRCPFDFDNVDIRRYHNNRNKTIIKSVTIGRDDPVIAISTASGNAILKK